MAKTDAEITLKVNMPPPTGPSFTDEVKRLRELYAQTNAELQKSSGIYKGMSEEARALYNEVKSLGSPGLLKAFESSFSSGFGTAATMDRQAARIGQNTRKHIGRVEQVAAAVRTGKLTEEQGLRYLKQPGTGLEMGAEALSDLEHVRAVTEFDQGSQGRMQDLVARAKDFNASLRGEAEGARVAAEEYRKLADARAEDREALDVADPLYAKRAQMLQQEENQLRRTSAELNKEADALDNVERKLLDQLDAYEETDEYSKDTYETIEKGEQKVAQSKDKIIAITGRQAEQDAKAMVNREKLEEAEKKRAEAEAKRIAEEEKRQAAAERRAAKEEQVHERELYRLELAGKKRLELAKIIKDLNAEREQAAKLGDTETASALGDKLKVARAEMENETRQRTMERMLYLQQAQAASRISGNFEKINEGLSNLNEEAEEGELDLVGMASSATDLWDSFQAGMGPIGWLMLALQGLQNVLNANAKTAAKLEAINKRNDEGIIALAQAYEDLKDAAREAAEEELRQGTIRALKADYDSINDSLAAGLGLIEAQVSAELRLQQLTQDEATFQRTLQKHELGKALAEGKISRHEYDLKLLEMNEDEAIASSIADVNEKKAIVEAERKKEEKLKEDNTLKQERAEIAKYEKEQFTVSEEGVARYEMWSEKLAKDEEEARAELDAILKEAEAAGVLDAFGVSLENALVAPIKLLSGGLLDVDFWDARKRKELEEAARGLEQARNRRFEYDSQMFAEMGNREVDEYLADMRVANEKYNIAQQEAASSAQSVKNARERVEQAEKKQAEAIEDANKAVGRAKENRRAQEEKLKTEEAERKAAEKRAEQIAKMEKDLDEKSLEELKEIRSRMQRKRREYRNRKSGRGYKDWTAAKERMDDLIEARERGLREQQEAVYVSGLNAEAMAGSRGAARSVRKRQGEIDIAAVNRVWQDGRIEGKGEIETLKKNLDAAIKARNAAAQEIITDIINFALADQRTSEKMRKELVKLKRKTEGGVR